MNEMKEDQRVKGCWRAFVFLFVHRVVTECASAVFCFSVLLSLTVDWQVRYFGSDMGKLRSVGQMRPGKLFNPANELEETILIVLESSNSFDSTQS